MSIIIAARVSPLTPYRVEIFLHFGGQMLRVALILTPVALITAIACGDSGSDSDSQNPGNQNLAGESSTPGGTENGVAGMSSSTENPGSGGSPQTSGGTTSTQGGKSGGGVSAGAPNEPAGGAENVGGAESAAAGAAGSASGPAPACPNLFGAYDVKSRAGACGDFDKNAPQSITGNDVTCAATFVSAPKTGKPAINGPAKLDAKGDFTKATLTLGSEAHMPCSGNWNAKSRIMTVACGAGATLCTIELQHQ
jgi:hypothetical protein